MDRIVVTRHPATIKFIASAIVAEMNSEHEEAGRIPATSILEIKDDMIVLYDGCIDKDSGMWQASCSHGFEEPCYIEIPIIKGNARPQDVQGKHVYGNLPQSLASNAEITTAVEFTGIPPRGQEYGEAEMVAAGAHLATYKVTKVTKQSKR